MIMSVRKPHASDDYWNLPHSIRAELINGELYAMAPPTRVRQRIVTRVTQQLQNHIDAHGGPCEVYAAPFAVNLDGNESTWIEPDISIVYNPSKLNHRGCEGAPSMIIEVVSPSSQHMDYVIKTARYKEA